MAKDAAPKQSGPAARTNSMAAQGAAVLNPPDGIAESPGGHVEPSMPDRPPSMPLEGERGHQPSSGRANREMHTPSQTMAVHDKDDVATVAAAQPVSRRSGCVHTLHDAKDVGTTCAVPSGRTTYPLCTQTCHMTPAGAYTHETTRETKQRVTRDAGSIGAKATADETVERAVTTHATSQAVKQLCGDYGSEREPPGSERNGRDIEADAPSQHKDHERTTRNVPGPPRSPTKTANCLK
ncbi:hypothetical protein BU15DRAFT_62822 [Melanogaster broomeanus]|nr:hypothetical protein BU15DRAFT_62822 [Melanogaster broomeanus]